MGTIPMGVQHADLAETGFAIVPDVLSSDEVTPGVRWYSEPLGVQSYTEWTPNGTRLKPGPISASTAYDFRMQ